MLEAQAVRLFATNSITRSEQAVIDDHGIHVESRTAVTDDLAAAAVRTREWAASFDRILVHVDVDVLDYAKFPVAENTDRRGGLELARLTELLTVLCDLPNWRALTICEVNPGHATDETRSIQQLIAMLGQALGSSIG